MRHIGGLIPCRGTTSSNPVPSTSESCAKLIPRDQAAEFFIAHRASGSGRSGLPDNGLEAAAAEKRHRPAGPARPVVIDLYILTETGTGSGVVAK
jgi:hypothetical protein